MTHRPQNFTVWMEIPVTDMDRAIDFYNTVADAGLTIDETGPNPMAVFTCADPATGVGGHLYPGTPSADGSGPTVHISVPGRLEDAIDRARDAGAQILSDPISIPAGRFAYIRDPDGNSVGLFQAA